MPIPLLAVLAAGQAIYGGVKAAQATKDFNNAAKDRKAYQTPQELAKILQATQNNAQAGYDAETLDYLTSQTDRAFTSSLSTTQQLGGDPNSASALFDKKMQEIMKIGANNHALNLENFSKYLGALNTMADSRAAEWASQQDIVKDRMQASNFNKQQAFKNIESGINTGISAFATEEQNKLYTDRTNAIKGGSNNTATLTPEQLSQIGILGKALKF